MRPSSIRCIALVCGLAIWACQTHGHGVAPIVTAKRITSPEPFSMAKIGDIITFSIEVTPVTNNASQGAGAYITEYIPGNTEVVGARLTDRHGNTVVPHRGPRMDDGYGPRGRHDEFDSLGLLQGSMSAIYADTGIFFSMDPRTARIPGDADLTVFNGIEIGLSPTGAGQRDDDLGFSGPPYYSHNAWDRTQALAFGVSGGTVGDDGRGNTPFGFGSPVAGPETHYPFEVAETPACSDGIDNDLDTGTDYPADAECSSALDDDETAGSDAPVGPWLRIRNWGSEIGTGSATDCENCASDYVRVGVPTDLGWELSTDNPLPSSTNAVRFSIGELVLGEQYFAEISLRVTGIPIDPAMAADVNCAEVFGGCAAMPQNGQDNTWRYYVPSPACVHMDTIFDLEVDKLYAVQGDTVTYTLTGKNQSEITQTNVVVTDSFASGDLAFVGMLQGPAPTVTPGLLTWPGMSVAAGGEYMYQWQMQVLNDREINVNRAEYVSDQLPLPGYSDSALTIIEPFVLLAQEATVVSASVSADSDARYTITITNDGTSAAILDGSSYIEISLAADFSYCAPLICAEPTVNATNVADPTINGDVLTFTSGLQAIPANGGTLVLEFSVHVDAVVPPDQYFIDVQSQFEDSGLGRNIEASNDGLAPLLVDILRSDPPTIDTPVAGSTRVRVWTSEDNGTSLTVFVNGNPAGSGSSEGPSTFVSVPKLHEGQRISATAQVPGEIESNRSTPEAIVIVDYCNTKTFSGIKETVAWFFEACETLVLGSSFIAKDNASIFLSSGENIEFLPGFTIEQGSTLEAAVCGQSLCETSSSPMPDGCHYCVEDICFVDPACCDTEYDQACLDKVDTVCNLVCE